MKVLIFSPDHMFEAETQRDIDQYLKDHPEALKNQRFMDKIKTVTYGLPP